MEFISFKNYNDFNHSKYTLQINQEFSITYSNGAISYFIIKSKDYSHYHNLNGPAYCNDENSLYYIYGDFLGTNLSNKEFEKLKNQYFKKLTFQ